MIPVYRVTHDEQCGAHQGFICSCDREALAARTHHAVIALVCATVVILALLAAVLR